MLITKDWSRQGWARGRHDDEVEMYVYAREPILCVAMSKKCNVSLKSAVNGEKMMFIPEQAVIRAAEVLLTIKG